MNENERYHAFCVYCDADEREVALRVYQCDPWMNVDSWICEQCFTPQDTGPCWDDLEEV